MSDFENKESVESANGVVGVQNPSSAVSENNDFEQAEKADTFSQSDTAVKTTSEQDQKIFDALDEILGIYSNQIVKESKIEVQQPKKKPTQNKVMKKGVGFLSLGLVLIFLGIMMLFCLFSPKHDFSIVLKLSPISAVLIGLEIFFNQIANKGRFKVNIPSVLISSALTVGCCFMCTSLTEKFNDREEEYNNRTIAAQIYDLSYQELRYTADIDKLDVKVDLNPDGRGLSDGVQSLSTDDIVDVSIRIAGVINTPKEFSRICKEIINAYRIMGINITNFHFSNESSLHTYTLDVEGKFAQDYSSEELESYVNHIYIKDMNYLEDLEDLEEKTEK